MYTKHRGLLPLEKKMILVHITTLCTRSYKNILGSIFFSSGSKPLCTKGLMMINYTKGRVLKEYTKWRKTKWQCHLQMSFYLRIFYSNFPRIKHVLEFTFTWIHSSLWKNAWLRLKVDPPSSAVPALSTTDSVGAPTGVRWSNSSPEPHDSQWWISDAPEFLVFHMSDVLLHNNMDAVSVSL